MLMACTESGPSSTNISSESFVDLSQKQAFLERYVNFHRDYHTLDFHIFYQNNSSGLVAGPSDWDIAIAAEIPCDTLDLWLTGFNATDQQFDVSIETNIRTDQIQEWFAKPSAVLGINRELCIVYYHSSSVSL